MKKILKIVFYISLVTVSFNQMARERLVHIGENAELFRQWHRVQDNYTLITSVPFYQEQDSEEATRGFRLDSSQLLKGKFSREIYDYDIEQSASNVYIQVRNSLKANGYEELFSCETKDCGDVSGWQLYLTGLVGDSEEKQYYLAARKAPVESKETEFVAFYISEIDGQTRTLVDIVSTPSQHLFDVVVETDDMLRTIEKDGRVVVDGIYFDKGSSVLKQESTPALVSMSQLLKANDKTRFAIVGHTDNTGSLEYNMKLSMERAKAVKRILLKKYNIKSQQVSINGIGTLSPMTSNSDSRGRHFNRRVELVKL